MKASLEIDIEHGRGGLRISGTLRQPPLWCRFDGRTLWLVGSAASPVGTDHVRMELHVGPDVEVEVRSVAATIAYAGRGEGTRVELDAEVESGATLVWRPEPLIVTERARHAAHTVVRLRADAAVCLDEVVVLGRSGEGVGRMSSIVDLSVDGDQRLLTSWDTSTPGFLGPGGVDEARVVATRLLAGAADRVMTSEVAGGDHDLGGSRVAVLRPDLCGALVTTLASDPEAARACLGRAAQLTRRGRFRYAVA